ncbi:MAG: tRNA pseudouridine(55) synthase TruB [Alphaproteobacteria bacterium]|jgi:tRNA pseudouridine55 synthase|nr:tRNA pseudouridine(55) synthase TruB [Alphaproteobacteria bacterium]
MGRRRKGEAISGWICLDKPRGLGSTPAVGRLRRLFNAQKAGHAGTLDPLADGVLPIALGEATKTIPFMTEAAKTYRFTLAWGESTTTLDAEGETVATSDVRPTAEAVAAALGAFVGEVWQTPPAFSALKINGARAYDLAREGQDVELAPRQVRIDALAVVAAPDPDHITLEMDCGKGVYVRAVARDLAAALGAEGHVCALRRTRVGPFRASNGITLETLDALCHRDALLEALLPVETALDDIPALAVTDEDAFRLMQGRQVVLLPRQAEPLMGRLPASRIVSAHSRGRLVALCEARAGALTPTRVFHL